MVTSRISTANVNAKCIKKIASTVCHQLGLQKAELSVTFVGSQKMRTLNRDYRGKDKSTDVLSFSQLEGEELSALPEGEPVLLGDLVISLERCVEQASDYGHSFERELGFLVAHGMLHLLGYDHQSPEAEAAMMAQTEEILGGLGLVR